MKHCPEIGDTMPGSSEEAADPPCPSPGAGPGEGSGRRKFDLVFLVGCGRSGTTWLQNLLAWHPSVVTSRETQVFAEYLSLVRNRWNYDARKLEADCSAYAVGPPTVMDQEDFLDICRQFACKVYDKVADRDPDAEILLDKTPNHLHEAEFILKVFPDACFIHLVRDPRAVVNSLLWAAEGWGSYWAPRSPVDAARQWTKAVRSSDQLKSLTTEVQELRYEDLHTDGGEILLRLWRWLGLEADVEMSREAVEACAIDRMKANDGSNPADGADGKVPSGFYRKGRPDSWKEELSRHQVAVVDGVCGDDMPRFGYSPNSSSTLAALRVRMKERIDQVSSAVERRVRSLLARI